MTAGRTLRSSAARNQKDGTSKALEVAPPTRVLRSSRVIPTVKNFSLISIASAIVGAVLVSSIQMEEYDENFNPREPIILGSNQYSECGVIVAPGRMPTHLRYHYCDELLVCRLKKADGTACLKPCISNSNESVKIL